MSIQMPTVIVDSGASVDDREDSMQMLRDQIHAQQCEINALRKALMYTHPVKELTDFEIKGVLGLDECWVGEDCSIPDMIAFARAILRKAQEK